MTEALALAAILESRQCDALLLIGDLRDQPSLIDELRFGQEPVVALWQGEALPGIPAVDVDNRYGVTTAMEHLRDLGHRRVAFIGGGSLGDIRERRAAFVDGRASGDLVLDGYVQDVANTPGDGVAAIQRLMHLDKPPTAVVVSTDLLALGVLHGAGGLGVHVPGDLSIVGFDDIRVAEFAVPALTTLRMPTRPMVDAALDIALRSIREPAAGRAPERRVFRPELVVRETTGAAPA